MAQAEPQDFAQKVLSLIERAQNEANNLETIKWMMNKKLIKKEPKCYCEKEMKLEKYKFHEINKFKWLCENPPYFKSVNILDNSFFGLFEIFSKINLQKALHLMYLWSSNESDEDAVGKTGLSLDYVKNSYCAFRHLCIQYFAKNPVKVGGEGVKVLYNLSVGTSKIKASKNLERIFIITIIENNSKGHMEILSNDEQHAIDCALQNVIESGSDVDRLEKNDSPEEMKPITSYWQKHENLTEELGQCTSQTDLDSYLKEMMWRERFGGDNAIKSLCDQLNCYKTSF